MSSLFDPVRKRWVPATPEEKIRQEWIRLMVEELGYPIAYLSVEKALKQLPHLRLVDAHEIPQRRLDILAFAKGIHPEYPLYPLLLIECKALPLTPQFAEQVLGYNAHVKAPYIAIANEDSVLTGCYVPGGAHIKFQQGLPSFSELLEPIQDLFQ